MTLEGMTRNKKTQTGIVVELGSTYTGQEEKHKESV